MTGRKSKIERDVITQHNSYKDISLLVIKDLQVGLVNERRKNHDSFWFIHNGHDGKVKDQCYKVKKEYNYKM